MDVSTCNYVDNYGFLPEELVIDILTRLPVKSLIRFRCVSRRWKDLIKNPIFISKHLTKMKNTFCGYSFHNSCNAVVVSTNDWMGTFECGKPDFPSDFLKLNVGPYLPYKPSYYGDGTVKKTLYSITGYCHGVFCLSWNHLYRHNSVYNKEVYHQIGHVVIALCNPALRELRILPLSNSEFPPYKKHCCVESGFGFHPKTNDYKVVKLVMLLHGYQATLDYIEVYSMASNSWRMILVRGNNYYSAIAHNLKACAFAPGICTSTGVFHWTMEREARYVIASFHMDDESLRVNELPTKYTSFQERVGRFSTHNLSLLHDKLALICCYHADGEYHPVDIYLLNNYDDGDSCWYLAIVIESFPCHLLPIGFWLKSLLLVFNNKDCCPLLYDTVSKQSMDLEQLTSNMGFGYRESLVLLFRLKEDPVTVILLFLQGTSNIACHILIGLALIFFNSFYFLSLFYSFFVVVRTVSVP